MHRRDTAPLVPGKRNQLELTNLLTLWCLPATQQVEGRHIEEAIPE